MKYYIAKVRNKRAEIANRELHSIIKKIGSNNIISITSGNGTEFSYTEVIENSFNLRLYKADPYCSG